MFLNHKHLVLAAGLSLSVCSPLATAAVVVTATSQKPTSVSITAEDANTVWMAIRSIKYLSFSSPRRFSVPIGCQNWCFVLEYNAFSEYISIPRSPELMAVLSPTLSKHYKRGFQGQMTCQAAMDDEPAHCELSSLGHFDGR